MGILIDSKNNTPVRHITINVSERRSFNIYIVPLFNDGCADEGQVEEDNEGHTFS